MYSILLPENISNILIPEAKKIEEIRYKLLNNFQLYGYEMVIPPLLEYSETIFKKDKIDLSTFKIIDQISGKILKIRNNITIQVTRIALNLIKNKSIIRLCFIGNTLYTKHTNINLDREHYQIGAIIYKYNNLKADIEIQELALFSLKKIGILNIKLSLSHTGILKSIFKKNPKIKKDKKNILYLLKLKDIEELKEITKKYPYNIKKILLTLPKLFGGKKILIKAKKILPANFEIFKSIKDLQILIKSLKKNTNIFIDLSDFNEYYIYNGIIFNIYVLNFSNPIVKGGRYKNIKKISNKIKTAIGFTMNLKELSKLVPIFSKKNAIYAPLCNNKQLKKIIYKLRNKGKIVVQNSNILEKYNEFKYNKKINFKNGKWEIIKL